MGITGLSSTFSSNVTAMLGAVLAGFGIWTTCRATGQGKALRLLQRSPHSKPPHAPERPSEQERNSPHLPSALAAQRPHPPLRVLRFIDADLPTANAGRMVISGRMSDVCAELDRLAAPMELRRRNIQ